MLSPQSKYAIQAIFYLHENKEKGLFRVEDIAEINNLPAAYLSKIFKVLTQKKILLSRRGKNGGVMLNPKQKKISFYDLCKALDEPLLNEQCVMFQKECNKKTPCPFHKTWSPLKKQMIDYLKHFSFSYDQPKLDNFFLNKIS